MDDLKRINRIKEEFKRSIKRQDRARKWLRCGKILGTFGGLSLLVLLICSLCGVV